jgi:hypothetical protein
MIDFKNAKKFKSNSFDERYDTYIRHVLSNLEIEGLCLEFGVSSAETTKKYVEMLPEKYKPMYGFDWFKGLPEKWMGHGVGAFSNDGKIPKVDGCVMVNGLFEDTLPNFIELNDKPISLLIVDCDLYSSTKTIFDYCDKNISVGTVIIFDEIHNGDGINYEWMEHEYKAFIEFVERNNVEFEWIAYVENGEQASCKITKK